jgi:hypothetical protein
LFNNVNWIGVICNVWELLALAISVIFFFTLKDVCPHALKRLFTSIGYGVICALLAPFFFVILIITIIIYPITCGVKYIFGRIK